MSDDWLKLREHADAQARSRVLAEKFADAIAAETLVVDLGCGTGSNLRYLQPFLNPQQRWLGLDKDHDVLSAARRQLRTADLQLEQTDFAVTLEQIPHGSGVAITASAFLDIVSLDWLCKFANRVCDSPLLIAMTVAGQPEWSPLDDADELIRQQLLQHQQSDHGFGESLGPQAANRLAELLRAQGCQVELRDSDWNLGVTQRPFVELLIRGVVRRARAMLPTVKFDDWEQRRMSEIANGLLSVRLKHVDLFAMPPARTSAFPG